MGIKRAKPVGKPLAPSMKPARSPFLHRHKAPLLIRSPMIRILNHACSRNRGSTCHIQYQSAIAIHDGIITSTHRNKAPLLTCPSITDRLNHIRSRSRRSTCHVQYQAAVAIHDSIVATTSRNKAPLLIRPSMNSYIESRLLLHSSSLPTHPLSTHCCDSRWYHSCFPSSRW